MRNLVVGIAGHIDHGKTSLVKSLTGISTDRLKEEKERQMSIDIGFAYLRLPSGREIDMIDVPGHEKFVKNMVCGASGIDVGLLVVAADDGVMPQTREHLDILRLIGVKRGAIVITKTDLADDDMLSIIDEDIGTLVEDTFLEDCPVVKFSARTEQGKEEVIRMLDGICHDAEAKDERKDFRMPIDHVFSVSGFGTVVTGTVGSGSIKNGDEIVVYPAGIKTRVRSLQTHTDTVQECSAGQRVGINISNVTTEDLKRGMIVARPGALEKTHIINVRIDHLSSSGRKLVDCEKVMLYTGTSESVARIVFIEKDGLEPGETGLAQFRLDRSIAPAVFDRFIIRRLSPQVTIGGGLILEVTKKKYRRVDKGTAEHLRTIETGSAEERVEELFRRSSFLNPMPSNRIARMASLGRTDAHVIIDGIYNAGNLMRLPAGLIHIAQYQRLKSVLMERLKAHVEKKPLDTVFPREEIRAMISSRLDCELFNRALEDLARDKTIVLTDKGIRLKGHKAVLNKKQMQIFNDIVDLSSNGDIKPIWRSNIEELSSKYGKADVDSVVDHLLDEKRIILLKDGSILTSEAYDKGMRTLLSSFNGCDGFDLGSFKDVLNVGRRAAVCLLEHFDSIGLTSRQGDKRLVVKTSDR